jgi:acyl-coenzyme A thioesterase PaaI-like protein
MRRFGHALIAHEADVDLLERVATAADRAASDLEAQPPRRRGIDSLAKQFLPGAIEDGARIVHFDECFVSGRWNPMGIGLEVFREGDGARATVTLGAAFEGAPGRSHGGIVAAIFDDIMGYLLSVHRVPAFTGEMTVQYLKATPIGEPIEFRSWVTHRDGRRILTEAEATSAGRRIATASATFIQVSPKHFQAASDEE